MGESIVVVGAGVAGLTLSHELCERNTVHLVEKEPTVGGLARSFKYNNFVFDIGPHRLHTEDDLVLGFINRILGNEKTVIKMRSSVYLDGKYHDWPLRPNTILKLKPSTMLKTLFDLIHRKKTEINSFEDYIKAKYGETLYTLFLKNTPKNSPTRPAIKCTSAGLKAVLIERSLTGG